MDSRALTDTRRRGKLDTDRWYKKVVYIKLIDIECLQALLQGMGGLPENKHTSWEISKVSIDTRKIRIENLPPEVAEVTLRSTLAPYEKIISIKEES